MIKTSFYCIVSVILFFMVILFMQKLFINAEIPTIDPSIIIKERELPKRKLSALAGDSDAAFALGVYYNVGFQKYNETIEWYTIGTENGCYKSQYNLAIYLLDANNNEFRTRGVFWLYMMAKNDYRETKNRLERLGFCLNTAQPPDDSFFINDYSQLNLTQLEQYKDGALKGNRRATWVLGKYYSDEIQGDNDLSKYWYRIGAQNGNPECQYILGQILRNKDNEFDQTRGEFWLRKADEV